MVGKGDAQTAGTPRQCIHIEQASDLLLPTLSEGNRRANNTVDLTRDDPRYVSFTRNFHWSIRLSQFESADTFRDSSAAQAAGYVFLVAGIVVAIGLVFHPMPAGGFREEPSVLEGTWWWGAIHVAIAVGFVFCVLGGLLSLVAAGMFTRHWSNALFWGSLTVGMIYFTGVAMINGWVMHELAPHESSHPVLYNTMNHLMIGFGWLGNPLFLFGLTGIAFLEIRHSEIGMSKWVASLGLTVAILSWGRGIGSATGLHFLEPLIVANIPAFLWLSYYGYLIVREARKQNSCKET